MTDLATVLALIEHADMCMSEPPLPDHEVGDMYKPCSLGAMRLKASAPVGKALAALVEAALAWRDEDAADPSMWPKVERDLAIAIDAYREATR